MKPLKAEFVKGVIGDDYGFKDNLPQIAFLGRSNAGKSSVINSLVNEKNLVRTSKTPGETREANFYRVDRYCYFVDFPGYGYAKRSIKQRNKMIKRILWYIRNSNVKPRAVFLIIDAKVGLTVLDREMIDILKKNNHEIVIVANKIDKMGKLDAKKRLAAIKEEAQVSVLLYSARTKEGKEEFIEKIMSFIKKS